MDLSEIKERAVRAVLERMPHAGTVRDNPLLGLGAVRTRLADTGTSATPDSLEWALLGLLSEIVTRRLNKLRAAEVVDHDPDDSHAAASQKMQGDFAAKSSEREAWCCLYYRFVSPHAFKVREIGSIARPNSMHGRKHGRDVGLAGAVADP